MSNPQLENGYIKIATEIWEALIRYRLSGEEMKCLMFIIRKTYGWHKKQDEISLSQFIEATGMAKSSVCRAIKNLKTKNIIKGYKLVNRIQTTYEFNKKYNNWKGVTKLSPGYNLVNQGVTKKRHTIDTITKDKKIYKRKIPEVFPLKKELKTYAFKKGIFKNEVEDIFEHFKNHHGAKGTLMLDWDKCWYTWVRNEIKFNPEKYNILPQPKQETIEDLCS